MRYRHRRSVRLRQHRYDGGLYFITVCTHGRQRLFGEVASGEMQRSAFGDIAHGEWLRTGILRPSVVLDAFVIMPDHVHLLFGIVEAPATNESANAPTPTCRGMPLACPPGGQQASGESSVRQFSAIQGGTVASIMRQYKAAVTRRIWASGGRETGPVWQRGYHDLVVCSERQADALRRYIADNPAHWASLDPDRSDGHRV